MFYFQGAVDWFSSQSYVHPGGVAIVGVSKGGEMSFLMALHSDKVSEKSYALSSICTKWPSLASTIPKIPSFQPSLAGFAESRRHLDFPPALTTGPRYN